MANTSNTYVGDGSTRTFAITWRFLQREHVFAEINTINRLNPSDWVFISDSQIQFVVAPKMNDAIKVFRRTPGDIRLVNFQNGAMLTEADLDLSADQNFFLAQEALENLTELINNELIRIGTANGIVTTNPALIIAGLVENMLSDAAAASLQQAISDINTNGESILDNGQQIIDAQVQINDLLGLTVSTSFIQNEPPVPGVDGVPNPIPVGARWFDANDNNHPYLWDSVGLVWQSLRDPRIGVNEADIVVLEATTNDPVSGVAANAAAIIITDATASTLNGTVVANAATVTTLSADVGTNLASFESEQSATASLRAAIAADIALLGVRNGPKDAFILQTSTVKLDSDGGDTIATRLTALAATDTANAALVATETTARISADSAEASLRLAVAARVTSTEGDISTANVNISSNVTAIAGSDGNISTLMAKFGVSLNVNGYITGFAQNNDGTTGSFVIQADTFAVVEPGQAPGDPGIIPFIVNSGVVTMQNVVINGNLVVAGSITATELNGVKLSDLFANMGTITAGSITLDANGFIRAGQTAFNTGTGFYLGNDGGTHKFSIGDGGVSNFLTWDGSTLTVKGNVRIGTLTASDVVRLTANTSRAHCDDLTFAEKKKFEIAKSGTVRLKLDVRLSSVLNGLFTNGEYKVKLDGVEVASGSAGTTTNVTKTHTITISDMSKFITIELMAGTRDDGAGEPIPTCMNVANVTVGWDETGVSAVITD